ncbi:MAG: hypothetical protein E7291_09530 [Lachnospiraceae bacterium]|nr:hypothetical protein [Lachnospiraceae bacterium]
MKKRKCKKKRVNKRKTKIIMGGNDDMRKLGKRKISVQRMNRKEENSRDWRLVSLYIGMVAGMTAYFSLVLNFLELIKVSDLAISIIGVIMAVLVLILMYFCGNYKVLDKIHNKKSLENILESFTLAGIFGFSVEKIINILPIENQLWSDIMPFIFMIVMFMFLPIGVILAIVKKEDWKHNVD